MKDLGYLLLYLGFILLGAGRLEAQLKYVVYDFEGCNFNQTNLPEGDYRYGDITYKVSANPIGSGGMIGNRVLEVDWNPSSGAGALGRDFQGTNAKFLDLNRNDDYFNFYLYNPVTNSKDLTLAVYLQDDDNYNNSFQAEHDDDWKAEITITRNSGWQLISIPLLSFVDQNAGGDGVFNVGYSTGTTFTGIQLRPLNLTSTDPGQKYYLDMLCFSEGVLPTGITLLDAPDKLSSDYCLLGAFTDVTAYGYNMSKIPPVFEGKLNPPGMRKLCITNYFVEWSYDGSNTPNNYLNVSWTNTLIASGYIPMITWEPWYTNLSYSHPVQPSLAKISAGDYDWYINAFADQVKLVNDTILIRLMHEMNGNWYPWCIANNGANNAAHTAYINAWRKIVDMFEAKGVTNVQWVWCVNDEALPYDQAYNNFVNCYPGDAYVDMVGLDAYNHPSNSYLPYWRSFRYSVAPSYYTLNKYFPTKPIYICEISSRERYTGHPSYGTEDLTSETKAQWIASMNQELESNFSKIRALIWFDIDKEHDWTINSSSAALEAFQNAVWSNDYYSGCNINVSLSLSAGERGFSASGTQNMWTETEWSIHPNPVEDYMTVHTDFPGPYHCTIYDLAGKSVNSAVIFPGEELDVKKLNPGNYMFRLRTNDRNLIRRFVKN